MAIVKLKYSTIELNVTAADFGKRLAKTLDEIASSHCYFIMQEAYKDVDDLDYSEAQQIYAAVKEDTTTPPTELLEGFVWVKASKRTPDKEPDLYKKDQLISCRLTNHKGIKIPCTATFENDTFYFEEFSPRGKDEFHLIEWLSPAPLPIQTGDVREVAGKTEIEDEFRMIISHALLDCDTTDVSKETWDLVMSECAKFAMTLNSLPSQQGKKVGDGCSNHKKEVAGIADMKSLAEIIGDLHYETLCNFFLHLSNKIYNDGKNDLRNNRDMLASNLYSVAGNITKAYHDMQKVWEISKPFMTSPPPQSPK